MSQRTNFERIVSTKPRRSADAQEAFVSRKGKRNKVTRHARHDWSFGEHHKTNVNAPKGRYRGEEL